MLLCRFSAKRRRARLVVRGDIFKFTSGSESKKPSTVARERAILMSALSRAGYIYARMQVSVGEADRASRSK